MKMTRQMVKTSTKRKTKARTSKKPMVKASPSQTFLSRGLVERTYRGSKWGIFLRAPKIFFVLKRRCGTRLVPLASLSRLRFGLKSGCDDIFLPPAISVQRYFKY